MERNLRRYAHDNGFDNTLTRSGAESLSVTKAVQATAESIQAVSSLYDTHVRSPLERRRGVTLTISQQARSTMLITQELCRDLSYPYSQYKVSLRHNLP